MNVYQLTRRYRQETGNDHADFLLSIPMYTMESNVHISSRGTHSKDFHVSYVGASGLWHRLRSTNYTSKLPDPLAGLFPGCLDPSKLGTKMGRFHALPPVSLTELRFFILTDRTPVAAVFFVPLAYRMS